MGLFNELKRRNVIRVAFAYAVVAWVLLQVVDLVMENIAAPEWVMKVFMLIMAIGFPVAVIIAWAYELTPDGIKRDSEVDPNQSIAHSTGRKLDRIIIAFLVVTLLLVLVNPFGKQEPAQTPAIITEDATQPAQSKSESTEPVKWDNSVAVLPFAFRSNNQDDEFFAAGMHDDLLTQLAKIKALKVISRTSVMEYKDSTKKIPQIAKELGVGAILEGGVQRAGARIQVNAQLIDARTDKHLWQRLIIMS